jgi:hypothetical protein
MEGVEDLTKDLTEDLTEKLFGWLFETGNGRHEPGSQPCCALFGFDDAVYENLDATIPSSSMKHDLAMKYARLFCSMGKRGVFHAASKFDGLRSALGPEFAWVRTTQDKPSIAKRFADTAVPVNVRMLFEKALHTLEKDSPEVAKREFVDAAERFQLFPKGCDAFSVIKFCEDSAFNEAFLRLTLKEYLTLKRPADNATASLRRRRSS